MTVKGMSDLDNTLYTDSPEFEFEYANKKEPNTLPPDKQTIILSPASIILKSAIALPTFLRKRLCNFFCSVRSFLRVDM